MVRNHREIEELIAIYAIGGLDGEDLECVEQHLPTCHGCREELARFERVTEALVAAVPEQQPPPELRGRIVGAVREAAAASPEPSEGTASERARSRWQPWRVRLLSAYAVAATLLLAFLVSQPDAQQAGPIPEERDDQREAEPERAANLLAGRVIPVSTTGELVRINARVVRGRDSIALVIEDLPPPPPGKVWQAWSLPTRDDAPRQSLGTVAGASAMLIAHADPQASSGIAITLEDDPGAEQPTSSPQVIATV